MQESTVTKPDLTCPFHEDLESCIKRVNKRTEGIRNVIYWILLMTAINMFLSGVNVSTNLPGIIAGM